MPPPLSVFHLQNTYTSNQKSLKCQLDWKGTTKRSSLCCSSLTRQLHGSFAAYSARICWHGSEFGVQDRIVQCSVHWLLNEQIIPAAKRANFYLALIFPLISVILCLWEREWGGKANISLPPGLQTDGRDTLVTPVTAPDLVLCLFRFHCSECFSLLRVSSTIITRRFEKPFSLQLLDADTKPKTLQRARSGW